MVIIKNINLIQNIPCNCKSWLEHWIKYSEQFPTYCPVEACMNSIEIGSEVQKESPTNKKVYIVPLCLKHNGQTGSTLKVNDHVKLVLAKSRKACG